MKVVEAKNLVVGETYITTINHYHGTRLMVWKKKGKIVHPNDIDHCWAQPVHTGWLSHRESFELIEQTKMCHNSSQPGKFVNIRTENDVTGWMWSDEYETWLN
jgi:hypothetical protein